MPQLEDPNFSRSVVLMVEHSAEGSWGLVVNRPSVVPVSEILSSLDIDWRGDPDEVVWSGGPVEPTSGWVIHHPIDYVAESTLQVTKEICLSTSPDQLRALAVEPPAQMRFLMGYSGWGAGQLEGELAEGAWLHAEVSAELLFTTPGDELWGAVLQTLGIDPASLIPARGVH